MQLDLSELKGNAVLLSALETAVKSGSVPHTWIIEGPDGSGKHTFATLFGKVLMCENDSRPCGICGNCKRFAGEHIDFHYVVPLKSENKTVGVNEMRALKEEIYINPISARCKVYVIENAEAVTVQGQNALLKMAEEPPENVYFILLTHNRHALLPTLISRAVCYSMEPLSFEDARAVLGKVRGADDEKIEIAVRLSGGYVGMAKSFLKGQTLSAGIEMADKFLGALADGDEYKLMMCGSPISESREKAHNMLIAVASAVGETIRIKAGVQNAAKLPNEAAEQRAASVLGYETLVNTYELIGKTIGDIDAYVNVNIAVTELMAKVWQVRVQNR